MNSQQILNLLHLSERTDLEFKEASSGFPRSAWETYSAMANTSGGDIVLGVREHRRDHQFEVQGLAQPETLQKQLWDDINNRTTISHNLLNNRDVEIVTLDGKAVLVIHVPRADRRQRPVHVGKNPFGETYRRFHEGDYRCSDDEVKRMLADQSDAYFDSQLLEGFTEADIDAATLRQYRNRFSARNAVHAWLDDCDVEFLRKLGGWTTDRTDGRQGPTMAGILMFGTENALQDLLRFGVNCRLDYRERVSEDIAERWNDRLVPDGTWTPNLFQFFQRAYRKLVVDLKEPFAYLPQTEFPDPVRAGMSPAHEAIQEALVNALIHADYRGEGGIVIERWASRFEFSNPGLLLVSIEQLYRGTVSECRNPHLQRMFRMIGFCDEAGSGFTKICRNWKSQGWETPQIEERTKPDRVKLTLWVSLPDSSPSLPDSDPSLPDSSSSLPDSDPSLPDSGSSLPDSDLSLPDSSSSLPDSGPNLPDSGVSLPDSGPSLPDSGLSLPDSPVASLTEESRGTDASLTPKELASLQAIAEPVREKRVSLAELQAVIRRLCQNRFLSAEQIANLLGRSVKYVRTQYIAGMVACNELELLHPNQPTHPKQRYRTRP